MKDDKMSSENIDGIIKSCRDIMRKDKGMNTDAQRIPQLLWMLFLKCFDDFELQKEILGEHNPIIEKPYRWRDWTSDEEGRRGEELIEFVNTDLFKYLSDLRGEGTGDQKDTVADIFQEQKNFMTDGYGMKDMIQQINKLDFTSSNQFHLIGSVYEKMLSSMKDDSPGTFGEFYTPRPLIKFMVKMINPSLKNRETILDPACGTSGFLIESFSYLENQVKGTADNNFLQKNCLSGIEPRPEPYLFSMMNMMLHGIEEPRILRTNTLETKISDINSKIQSDIIMTNPPFGGEESDSIKKRFPAGYQTKDTALGFILHCMARLKDGGRCAVILPDGPLFQKGIAAKIKKKLLEECNLHTIIRMPKSVFAPYTTIATNILFFEKGTPTKEVWIYELPKRDGGKSFNKTNPITIEHFQPVLDWWGKRKTNDHIWKIKLNKIIEMNYEIDNSNPNRKVFEETRSPEELMKSILNKEQKMKTMFNEIQVILKGGI
jgi:type I restriction enzyme M protein